MTNEQLVAQIKDGEDVTRNMEQLYLQVRDYIHSVAMKYRNSGEVEDLEQEGYLALHAAIEKYDPGQGFKFLTYAAYYIRQGMQRYLQVNGSCLRLPVHCQEKIQRYNRFCQTFKMEHGRKPTDTEIAAGMDLILEQVWEIKENAQAVHLGSLDAPVMGIEGSEDATVGELTGDDTDVEGEVVEQIQDGQLKDALWGCVDSLPDRQPEVIRKRYQQDMTLAEIGKTYGVTAEAVRQTHAKALRELRKPRAAKQLRPFLPGVGIYEGGIDSFNRTWTSSTERAALSMAESMEIEERRREKHMELLDKIRAKVAISQQKGEQHE